MQKSASQPSKREALLSAAIGAAAAIAIGFTAAPSPSFAIGEGTDGATETAKNADSLLKAADKLTTEDSPARFGADDDKTGTLAQQ